MLHDGKSVGLPFPGQCSQHGEGTIKLPHLNHSVFHERPPWFLSLSNIRIPLNLKKQLVFCISITGASAFATLVMSFSKISVDTSSSTEMVSLLVAAILVIDATKLIVVSASSSIVKYITAT